MKIKTQFTHDKVRFDQTNDIHLVVTLQAPKLEQERKRSPICIVPVIDISTSMAGEKLYFAKQSMLKLIEHLQPGDFCGLVAFHTDIIPVMPPREMTQAQKDQLSAKIGELSVNGCTNLAGGMLQGLEWANKTDLPEGTQIRTILFTDGHANEGPATDKSGLLRLLEAHLGKSSLSAFGYGTDADQDLLAELAKLGDGNYAFIRNPEDALTAFAKELGGLLSTYATALSVDVGCRNGHKITQVVSDVDSEERDRGVLASFPNLYSEEERHLVFAVSLSEQNQPLPRVLNVAEVKVTYEVLEKDGTLAKKTAETKAKIRFVKPGEEQTQATKEVDNIVSLAQLVAAQIEAEGKAQLGDYAGAQVILRAAGDLFGAKGQDSFREASFNLCEAHGSSSVYFSSSGYRGSMKGGGSRVMGLAASDSIAAEHLENLGVKKCMNKYQDDLVQDFTNAGNSQDFAGSEVPSPPLEKKGKKLSVAKTRSRW